MGWFGGRGDHREGTRDAIVGLRSQLLVLEKKEEFLQKKIDEEMKRARANATTNKRCEWSLPLDKEVNCPLLGLTEYKWPRRH